jgi:hypothetical protein
MVEYLLLVDSAMLSCELCMLAHVHWIDLSTSACGMLFKNYFSLSSADLN